MSQLKSCEFILNFGVGLICPMGGSPTVGGGGWLHRASLSPGWGLRLAGFIHSLRGHRRHQEVRGGRSWDRAFLPGLGGAAAEEGPGHALEVKVACLHSLRHLPPGH